MSRYIETKVSSDKKLDNGATKRVAEAYLVDALSFTEAEKRIIEEVAPYISGEFSVAAVKKSNIAEIFFNDNGDRWYKVKANFITLDEKTAAEKRKASYFLVQACDFRNALENFVDGMKGTIADFEIASIVETNIVEVYLAKAESVKA